MATKQCKAAVNLEGCDRHSTGTEARNVTRTGEGPCRAGLGRVRSDAARPGPMSEPGGFLFALRHTTMAGR